MHTIKATVIVVCQTPERQLAQFVVSNLQTGIKDMLERGVTGGNTCVSRNTTIATVIECTVDGMPMLR
jgi:hypothetical protein